MFDNDLLWSKAGDTKSVTEEPLLATRSLLSAVGHEVPVSAEWTHRDSTTCHLWDTVITQQLRVYNTETVRAWRENRRHGVEVSVAGGRLWTSWWDSMRAGRQDWVAFLEETGTGGKVCCRETKYSWVQLFRGGAEGGSVCDCYRNEVTQYVAE